jgi:hypothetical protein
MEHVSTTEASEALDTLWPPFGVRVTCGLMRQAICALCLDHLGFEEVTSGAFADNPASLAVSRKVGYRVNGQVRLARKGEVATNVELVLAPADLVRPPYDVEVAGVEAFRTLVGLDQARAT